MTHELPDADLLTRYRSGDDVALGYLFERYEEPVFRFLYGVLKDHHQAEDALQETFIQALRKADAIDPATFRGWLYTVAYQQAILQKRRARRLPASPGPEVLVGVEADGSAMDLETAIGNLLDNALRFAPPSSLVRVTVDDGPARTLVIAVEDEGPGVPEDDRARIFERFFTTDAERRGTGLGLAIVRAVAEAHGGSVRFEPRVPHGSRFVLTLPAGR